MCFEIRSKDRNTKEIIAFGGINTREDAHFFFVHGLSQTEAKRAH